ncbi:MAG: DUF192 domain-containing protein [Candidatus Moranbacteria bacterium]|jgi:hypothetical protein|nr:DUF192 domain-containing protein [Candidatus Moranbacteria bacterium]
MQLNKKYIWVWVVLAGIFFALPVIFFNKADSIDPESEKIVIDGKEFSVEIVKTAETREKGLGGRKSLCGECGMLFEFDDPGKYSFWMKDMQFPIDIIWISGDDIVYIENNVSHNFQGVITPPVFADKVLELSAGTVKNLNINVGGKIIQK